MSFFVFHDRLNALLYRTFNVASDAYFFGRLRLRRLLARNVLYRNLHSGERCFIVATGPSILKIPSEELEFLRTEMVFAVNSFYKAESLSGIIPSYYVLMDNDYWGPDRGVFAEIAQKYGAKPPTFITDIRALPCVPSTSEVIGIYAKNYPVDRMRYALHGNLSAAMNVVGFAILSAIYMGFREIYLLGSDYNLFCQRAGNHCYDDSSEQVATAKFNLSFYLKYYHLTTEFHYKIAELAKSSGVRVVNFSDGSLLDAYPLGSFSAFLTDCEETGKKNV